MRRTMTVLAPFIVLLLAWALAARSEMLVGTVGTFINMLPYIVAFLALFMSIWYQNSNTFYMISFILISFIFINISSAKHPMLIEVVTMVSILLPMNAVWLGFSKERGVVSTYGRNKAIIILGQIIWVFVNMMEKSNIPVASQYNEPFISLKAPSVVLYILSICILLTSYILKNQYLNLVFIAVLISSFVALYFAHKTSVFSIFISAIFLMIVIALFEISYTLAFYDPLTGVLSRRALEQELMKLRSKYSIAMVDIDHFKHINDNYGHDVGDEVLKMIASLLNRTSGHAKVFRYGGEEFVILFNCLNANQTLSHLERIRKIIERRPFFLRSENRPKEKPENVKKLGVKDKASITVTVSIGVAQKNDLLKTSNDVIRKADEALYKSKNSGRNCITKIL